jgi:hypothetical protein
MYFGIRALATTLVASLIGINLLGSCKECSPEMLERLSVPDSTWIVETWLAACGFGISGPLEVRAVNARSKQIVTVAVVDDPAHTTVSVNSSNDLVITLPNLVSITGAKAELGGVKVICNYQPNDDPEERAKRQRFARNPNDPEAKEWYCDNVAAKMNPVNRDTWSKMMRCPR